MSKRLVAHLAVVALLMSAMPTAAPVRADSGEGRTVALRDQQRRITVGGLHTCAILDSGAVQCWGFNDQGQLGNGTRSATTRPTTVTDLSAVVSLAAGSSHTCALVYGGAVKCWGLNSTGQTGVDPVVSLADLTPVAVPGVSTATAIAAGAFHNCAVLADGTVRCWGVNGSGQLGDGTTGYSFTPVEVSGITSANPAVAITAGDFHSCAVLADGSARCWGHNGFGQLGDGTTTTSLVPVPVSGVTNPNGARAIAAGSGHTCALLDDATVRCWGHNFYGQLGNDEHGSGTDKSTPVTPKGNPQAVAITAGTYHTCALRSDGEARCWGNNGRGQLAYLDPLEGPNPVDQDEPREVQNFSSGTAITAGGFTTCALVGAAMQCWGYNFFGQLGGYRSNNPEPVAVTSLTGASAISVGDGHACALVAGAETKAQCWGLNSDGQLGAPVGADSTVPVVVGSLGQSSAISAGNRFSCVLEQASSSPKCFGFNANGQLGDGSNASSTTPVPITGLTTATQVSAGGAFAGAAGQDRGHACARRADATAVCWGRNFDGQLGDDSTTDSNVPVVVDGLTGVVAVATGGFHSCAIVGAGAVKCWGNNDNGQLGNEDEPNDSDVPVDVDGITNATALALGAFHSCARLATGKVRCWGDNAHGQLGDDSTTDREKPVEVAKIPGVVGAVPIQAATAIAAGDFHTCALHADSRVTCWGENADGQLGDGSTTDRKTPNPVPKLAPPPSPNKLSLEISAGRRNTCARVIETTVLCWGDNSSGQLGDGIGPTSLLPITVANLGAGIGANHIPEPVDDQIVTAPLTAAAKDLLANDTDPDPGDVLTVTSVSPAGHGTVSLAAPGTATYTPDAYVCDPSNPTYGTDSFNYAVSDGTATVGASVSVVVTCPNRPPVAVDDVGTVLEDTSTLLDVLGNDSDPDGDPLTITSVTQPSHGATAIEAGKVRYTPTPDSCGPDSFTYTVSDGTDVDSADVTITVTCAPDAPVANPDNAATTENAPVTLDVLANDQDVDPSTVLTLLSVGPGAHGWTSFTPGGDVTYHPDLGFCGVDTFQYIVSDGSITDTGTVTITVGCVNDGPNAVDDSAITDEDSSVLIDVLANDTDPDGDPLTIESVTQPSHGTAVVEAGKIRYTPNPDFCGSDSFGYVARDPSGETDGAVVAPVAVICNQDPPVAVDDVANAIEDTPAVIPVLANDVDVDNDPLSIASVTDPPHGSAVIGPSGTVTYTPDPDYCGPDTFDYVVSDGQGGTDTGSVAVTVACVNDAPTLDAVVAQSTAWGQPLSVALTGHDVDGPALTYSVASAPAGVTVGSGTGVLVWTPTSSQIGVATVTVAVSDGQYAAQRSFQVTVTKRATSVAYTGATTGQYSDQASVSASLTDASLGAANGTGVPSATMSFAIGSQAVLGVTNASGSAAGSIVITSPAGATTTSASFAGSSLYLPSSSSNAFTVTKEGVTAAFTGSFVTTSSSSAATVPLSATVTEDADGRLGTTLHSVVVTFKTLGGAALCSSPVTAPLAGSGTASCNASLGVGSHPIVASMSSSNYAGQVVVGAVVVGTSATGTATGGGVAGGENFAFTANRPVRKSPPTGSAVHVWTAGAVAYVAVATDVSSFSTSCSGGGNNKACGVSIATGSGPVSRVDLATGLVTPIGPVTLAIAAKDASVNAPPDTYSVAITGASSHQLGIPSAQVAVSLGSVTVL